MRPDHETIRSSLPASYTMTNYSDLAWSKCDGSATPWDCSGLAVVSRLPIFGGNTVLNPPFDILYRIA